MKRYIAMCGCLCLLISYTEADTVLLIHPAHITINDSGAATPYPSIISAAGFPNQIVTSLTVTLRGLEHTYPDDLDIMLESPSGLTILLMSDCGADANITNVNLTFDDAAAQFLPDSALVTSGTYRPTNHGLNDTLPAPAPRPGIYTNLADLAGSAVNGRWKLYVTDDTSDDAGAITNGWTLTLHTTTSPPPRVVISEFRVRGPNGERDEYVVLHNLSDYPHVVTSVDTSAGWSVAATNGIRFVITNGTVFAPRGYFLGVNTSTIAPYSLAGYPAGSGSTATGDVNFSVDIPDNAGIALFRSAIPTNLNLTTRLDAVGSTSGTNTLYREGAGYPPLTPFSIDYAFVRNRHSGEYQDTGDNARDFLFVDSNGTSAGAGQRLGAPGPRNRTSPTRLINGDPLLTIGLVDEGVGMSESPNRFRDFTFDPANNSSSGTLSLRRRITNNSVAGITRLRFRVVDLTTFPAPTGIADLRPRTSTNIVVNMSTGGTVVVTGTMLEQPPSQPNGGGFNSSLSVTSITTSAALFPNTFRDVQFLLGIQQTINYRFAIIPETTPAMPTEALLISGNMDSGFDVESLNLEDVIRGFDVVGTNAVIQFTSSLIRKYRLQANTNLLNHAGWTNISDVFTGQYTTQTVINGGTTVPHRNFRLITTP